CSPVPLERAHRRLLDSTYFMFESIQLWHENSNIKSTSSSTGFNLSHLLKVNYVQAQIRKSTSSSTRLNLFHLSVPTSSSTTSSSTTSSSTTSSSTTSSSTTSSSTTSSSTTSSNFTNIITCVVSYANRTRA
ncbi:hypothetical protein L9F63_005096, partial [Diploptera punctata]